MKFEKFNVGDTVKISKKSDKEPKDYIGTVVDITDKQGIPPYTVDWDDGTTGKYNTVDLISENDTEKEPKRVVPLSVIHNNSTKESDAKSNKEKAKEAINQTFDDYKDYFDQLVMIGHKDDVMELFFIGLTPEEAYFDLHSAALQLMHMGHKDNEDE